MKKIRIKSKSTVFKSYKIFDIISRFVLFSYLPIGVFLLFIDKMYTQLLMMAMADDGDLMTPKRFDFYYHFRYNF